MPANEDNNANNNNNAADNKKAKDKDETPVPETVQVGGSPVYKVDKKLGKGGFGQVRCFLALYEFPASVFWHVVGCGHLHVDVGVVFEMPGPLGNSYLLSDLLLDLNRCTWAIGHMRRGIKRVRMRIRWH